MVNFVHLNLQTYAGATLKHPHKMKITKHEREMPTVRIDACSEKTDIVAAYK